MTIARYLATAAILHAGAAGAAPQDTWRFAFTGTPPPGYTPVGPATIYNDRSGFGFEPGSHSPEVGQKPFFFSADVPEGNHAVTVTFGATAQP